LEEAHQQRKGDALNLSIRSREKSSKNWASARSAPKVWINQLIISGGRERNYEEGKRSSQRNLKPWRFSSRAKSQKEVCADFCKECRRNFENSLSLKREIVLSAQRSQGIFEVLKIKKSPLTRRR
jgi:hypothetical protein